MSRHHLRNLSGPEQLARRAWLLRATAGAAACAGMGMVPVLGQAPKGPKLTPPEEAEKEREKAIAKVRAASSRPLNTANSERYQAIGDATLSFIKVTLGDCELIAQDYLDHYHAKGFEVKRPARRMTLIVFSEERLFLEFARKSTRGVPPQALGYYSRAENWLVFYDIRNEPAKERGAAHKNVRTLAHEATHQLSFNTGLLNRPGDVPFAIFEGLACYSETRPLHGHSAPGEVNGSLLDELAHIQRRANWFHAAELLTKDGESFGTTVDQTRLAYAQSWLLVYNLMKTASRLPQFKAYLKTIYPRTTKDHRLEDAQKSFGDLDRLDQELRRESIRLQQAPRP
jgi:hypothetical protein